MVVDEVGRLNQQMQLVDDEVEAPPDDYERKQKS